MPTQEQAADDGRPHPAVQQELKAGCHILNRELGVWRVLKPRRSPVLFEGDRLNLREIFNRSGLSEFDDGSF